VKSESNPKYYNEGMGLTRPDNFEIMTITDGTSTISRLFVSGYVVATGVAKRRKTDKKHPDLGAMLALSRMFSAAADRYAAQTTELLYPEPTGVEVTQHEIGRARKAKAKERRFEKRKAARQAHAEAQKSDPDDWDLVNAV
jgi:hypothetical protein